MRKLNCFYINKTTFHPITPHHDPEYYEEDEEYDPYYYDDEDEDEEYDIALEANDCLTPIVLKKLSTLSIV